VTPDDAQRAPDGDAGPSPHGERVGRIEMGSLHAGIGAAESAMYIVAALLLIVAAGFTLVGTVTDLVEGSASRAIADAGVFLLDRILLLFIIAELLYTLRVVNFSGRILVEPFLFIGLIAVVRKVLVLAAEAQQGETAATDFLTQIGALSLLALVLALSIFLLRRSAMPPST
jgi:uncharacterized membrane protein (DUF373 family)